MVKQRLNNELAYDIDLYDSGVETKATFPVIQPV
jgi:hypothetical protein